MNLSTALLAALILTADPTPEQLSKTRSDLASSSVEVRRTAIKSLVHSKLSDYLFPEMHSALKDADGDVRATAATAIGNLGATSAPAIPTLIAQLEHDTTKEARETAARALGRIGKAAPTQRSAVGPLKTAAAGDADFVTRTVALGALAMMNEDVSGQIASLRKYLTHEEPLVRMKASHALGGLGEPAKAAAPEIALVMEKEPDGHRRGYVARALGNVGDPAFLPALEKALAKETDTAAQGEMRGAIKKLRAKS